MLTQLQLLHRQLYTAQSLKHHDTGFSYAVYSYRYLELGTRIHAMTTRQPLQAKNEKIISPWCQDGVATFIYIKRHGNKQQLFVYSLIKIVTLCDNCGESVQLGWHCTMHILTKTHMLLRK